MHNVRQVGNMYSLTMPIWKKFHIIIKTELKIDKENFTAEYRHRNIYTGTHFSGFEII